MLVGLHLFELDHVSSFLVACYIFVDECFRDYINHTENVSLTLVVYINLRGQMQVGLHPNQNEDVAQW